MSKNPSPTRLHIRSSFRDSIYTSLNIGMAESYFCPFLLALGVPAITAGLGVVLAQFIGTCIQLIFIRFCFDQYSLKKRLLIFLGIQALSLLPLVWSGWQKIDYPPLLIAILGLYWGCVLTLNPPWTKLMGHTVPKNFRLSFFSIRNQFGQISVLVGLVLSGFWLSSVSDKSSELPIFVAIFGIGFVLKSLSWLEVRFFHQDYIPAHENRKQIGIREFVKRLKGSEQGRLITFLFFFFIAVHTASPFFTPYMFNKLKLSYLEFMAIVALSFAGRLISLKLLQRWAKPRQINGILIISAVGISTSPLLWTFSQNYGWILLIEFLSGCYWAGFELSTTLIYYKKIADHERTRVMSYISFFNISGMALGSILGACIIYWLPPSLDQYLVLFAIATFLRILVVIFIPHVSIKGRLPQIFNLSLRTPFTNFARPVFGLLKRKKKDGSRGE